jgi:replicative DNA helicase
MDRAARFAAGKLSSLTRPAFDQMRRRRAGEEKPVPLPWSRVSEELHGGLWPGCWILVGGTGVGKSQWAFEVAYNAAVRHAVPVVYVGLELDETGLVARLAALGMHGRTYPDRVPWSGLYLGRGTPDPLRWFDGPGVGADVLAELDAAPFYLETGDARGGASGWSYREIARLAEDLRAAHPDGPALLVVDFLQLVGSDPTAGHREDLRERIGNAAYAARMAARKHNISVLLLSATARGYYSLFAGKGAKAENIPDLGSGDSSRFLGTGKESGETEYAADGVLALCRGPWPKGAAPPDVWLAVAKARTGRGPHAGWCCYGFDGTTFTEKDPPPPPEDPPAGSSKNQRGRSYDPVED